MIFVQVLLALFIWYKVIPYIKLVVRIRKLWYSENWDTVNRDAGEWRKD